MSLSGGSFAFEAGIGVSHSDSNSMWCRHFPDINRKSKRKALGDADEPQQQFHPLQHFQQHHILHHQQMFQHEEEHNQPPGIPIELQPQTPTQHQTLPHYPHNHHPPFPHHPPPIPAPSYDAAFPPRPPVIDPITALPPVSAPPTQFRRPPSGLHENLFPAIEPNHQVEFTPHHRRRPPFHTNPAIPVGESEVDSLSYAEMDANNELAEQFPTRPIFEQDPSTELPQNEQQYLPDSKENEALKFTREYKRRRIHETNDFPKTQNPVQTLNSNLPNLPSTPSVQSPIHICTNSSAVAMSPAVNPTPTPAFLPTPSPLSLSQQSTTRLFADISNVSTTSSASSISSASTSLMASPHLVSTPIASLVRSPMLRPLNGRYAHLQAITNKGFGATYKAWDLLTSKPVFLKRTVLSSRVFSQREASFMKLFTCFRRRCPGSLRFLVDYVDDFICQLEANEASCHWLALDYVSGGDLVQLLRECHSLARPLQEDDVRIILHRLCEAIRELHLLRVVHMDVSLENICIQWLNGDNAEDDARVQLLLIDFEWSMMDMRGNALQQMVAQMDAEAHAANGTPQFQELQTNAMEMRKAYDHVMLHPTPMHYYSDQYSDRRLRLQRRHEAVGKISYLSSEAKNLHSSFDPYKNEVFAIGACAYRLMFMCGPGEKNALTDSRTISNEFLSFLTETFQPEEKRIHSEDLLSHPWLAVANNANHHVRTHSQALVANSQMNSVAQKNPWQQFEMDEKTNDSAA